MALDILEKDLNRILNNAKAKYYKGYLKPLGAESLIEFKIGGTPLIQGCIKGASLIIESLGGPGESYKAGVYKTLNSVSNWNKVITAFVQKIKSEGRIAGTSITIRPALGKNATPSSGFYFTTSGAVGRPKNNEVALALFSKEGKEEALVDALYDNMMDDLWTSFIETVVVKDRDFLSDLVSSVSEDPAYTRKGKLRTLGERFKRGAVRAHDPDSTRAALAIQDLHKQKMGLDMPITINTKDIQDHVFNNVNIDWKQTKLRKKYARYEVKTAVSITFGPNPTGLGQISDLGNIRKVALDYIKKEVAKNKNSLGGITEQRSRPISDEIIEDLKKGIGDSVKGSKTAKSKIKAKQMKSGTRTERIKPKRKKATKVKNKAIKVAGATRGSTARAKEKKKEDKTVNLLTLKRDINRRLPAEVRRNMGRPALINRSGTFSNSARLLSISQAKTGLTGGYTYMKTGGGTPPRSGQPGVYQTFENKSGRWPAGYNPKDLITKSIRKLAKEIANQKFVQLRRG